MCGSEGVQAELAGDEGGDDERGGRVEVEVEGHLLVERLHRGGWQRRRRRGAAGWHWQRGKQPRMGAGWAIRPETRTAVFR